MAGIPLEPPIIHEFFAEFRGVPEVPGLASLPGMTGKSAALPFYLLLAQLVVISGCAGPEPPLAEPLPVSMTAPPAQPITTPSMRWLAPRANGAGFEVGAWQHVLRPPALPALYNGQPAFGAGAAQASPDGERAGAAVAALRRLCAGGQRSATAEELTLIAWLSYTPPGSPATADCTLLAAADALQGAMAPWR